MADNGSGGTSVTLEVVPGTAVPPTVVQTPPPPSLAFTGFALTAVLLLAVLLISLGSVLVLTGRSLSPSPRSAP